MSSVTKTGPKAYFSAWEGSAAGIAIHYIFSVATMVWFLSLESSPGPVLPNGCIDTKLPTTIDMGLTNAKLIEEVFRQGIERIINTFARTTGSKYGSREEGEDAARRRLRQGVFERQLADKVANAQTLDRKSHSVVETLQDKLDGYNESLEKAGATVSKLRANTDPTPAQKRQLASAIATAKSLTDKRADAQRALADARLTASKGEQNVIITARSAAFDLRAFEDSDDVIDEDAMAEQLREDRGACKGRLAKLAQTVQSGGNTTGARKTGPAVTAEALGEAEAAQELIEDTEEVIALGEKMVGCKTPFHPVSITTLQEYADRLATKVLRFVMPTTMIDMDRKMMAGDFTGQTNGGKTVSVEFESEPLTVPKDEPPMGTLAAVALGYLRPIVYMVLGLIFAGYLAYTLVGIPFAWLMNAIRTEFFSQEGAKLPLWKSGIEQLILLGFQGTVLFFTFPLWLMAGGSVWFLTTLVVLTPFAFFGLAQTKRPKAQVLYYAAVSAVPFALITLGFKGLGYLDSKLPQHSEVASATKWAWYAMAFAATGCGIGALVQERSGNVKWLGLWKALAWTFLVLLMAMPPLAVKIEEAM